MEEKNQRINSIQMLCALELFDNKKYTESMKIFIQLNTNPTDVIKLFPELSSNNVDSKTDADQPLAKAQDSDSENSLLALIDYLREVRPHVDKFPQSPQILETIDTTLLKCYLQVMMMIFYNFFHFFHICGFIISDKRRMHWTFVEIE